MFKFFTILFFLSLSLQAQVNYDSLVSTGINQIYSIKFEEAQKTFDKLKIEFPNHPAALFFDAMIIWWRVLLDLDSEKYDDPFYDKLEETIDFCDEILDEDENNVDALFFKGGALGFRGRLLAIRRDFLDAAMDGKDALPLVFKVYEVDSTNIDSQLGFGIYNYYAAVIPKKYPFVEPFMFMFPEGDRELGLKQLKNAAENGKYAKYESLYFLTTLYYLYEEDHKTALHYAEKLIALFPDNPIFERYIGRIYIKLYGYPKASNIWKSIYDKCKLNVPGYNTARLREAVYYIAMDSFHKEKFDTALTLMEESYNVSLMLDEDKESGWLVNSTLFMGYIYDVKGYREGAIAKYKEVLDMEEYNSSHEKAQKYIKEPYKK